MKKLILILFTLNLIMPVMAQNTPQVCEQLKTKIHNAGIKTKYCTGTNGDNSRGPLDGYPDYLENIPKIEELKIKGISGDTKALTKAAYSGSGGFVGCQLQSHKKWNQIANKQQSSGKLEEAFKVGFQKFLELQREDLQVTIKAIEEQIIGPTKRHTSGWIGLKTDIIQQLNQLADTKGTVDTSAAEEELKKLIDSSSYTDESITNLAQKIADLSAAAEQQLLLLQTCSGLAAMTHYVDYDKDNISGEQKTKTYDGKFECYSAGAETQDYPACANAVTAYNAAAIGQKGLEVVQSIVVQDNLNDKQMELATSGATSTADITKNALEAQKTGVEEQKKVAEQRVVFHGAKLATMLAIHQSFPTVEDMIKSCTESGINSSVGTETYSNFIDSLVEFTQKFVQNRIDTKENHLAKLIQTMQNQKQKVISEHKQRPVEELCQYVINSGEFSLVRNQQARDVLTEIMMTAGVDMVTDGMTANILAKQADRIDEAITGLDNFEPEDLPGLDPEAILERYCTLYPNDAKCAGLSFASQGTSWDGTGLSFDGGSGLSTVIGSRETSGTTTSNSGSSSTRATSSDAPFVANSPVSKSSGIEEAPVVGALKASSPGGAGGGGGISGGGGGLPAAGSSGASRSVASKSTSSSSMPSYQGGSGSFKYLAGKGVSRSTASSTKNPLADFFKKKTSSTSKSLSFGKRGIASKSGSSIWKIISKGYNNANKNKRLMDYETIKNSMETDI